MAQRKPFTFSQPAASKPPPPPQQPKPQPPPASARAQLLLANSAKIRAKHPEPPKKKPRLDVVDLSIDSDEEAREAPARVAPPAAAGDDAAAGPAVGGIGKKLLQKMLH